MTKSKFLLYSYLFFIGGIFVESFSRLSLSIEWIIFIFGGLFVFIFVLIKRWKFVLLGFFVLFFLLGVLRCQDALLKIDDNKLSKYNGRNVVLVGRIVREPDVRETNTKITVKVNKIFWKNIVSRDINGRVLITTNLYPEYKYGDELQIKGKLRTPQVFKDFNYRNYLAKDGIYSVMYYSKIKLVRRKKYMSLADSVYGGILRFKNQLRKTIYQNISPPQSSILGAIILGDKSRLSKEFKKRLSLAGLRHITAISGMHVAILTSVLMSFLIGLGFWRGQAFYITVFIVSFFIVMTGLQPSAIRAGIMGGLFLLAQHIGRMNSSFRSLFLVAAIMLAQNPLLLRLDVGFQLSFLAMLGIIELGPIFRNWMSFIPNSFQLRDILSMTLSAQFFTFPILVYNFGYLSLVSPITNLLVVPILPLVIGFGFVFALSGAILPVVGWVLSWFNWFLLSYITKIVYFFSDLPFSSLTIKFPWQFILVIYLVLTIIVWRLQEKRRLEFLNH